MLRFAAGSVIIIGGTGLASGLGEPGIGDWANAASIGITPLEHALSLSARDTCPCLPKMCIDEVMLKGTTTVLTYICPATPTVVRERSTIFITVTEYTTVTPVVTENVPKMTKDVPYVTAAASITVTVEPTSTTTLFSTVFTTITLHSVSSESPNVPSGPSSSRTAPINNSSALTSYTNSPDLSSSNTLKDEPSVVQHETSHTYPALISKFTLWPGSTNNVYTSNAPVTTSFPTLDVSGTWGVFPPGPSQPTTGCNSSLFTPAGPSPPGNGTGTGIGMYTRPAPLATSISAHEQLRRRKDNTVNATVSLLCLNSTIHGATETPHHCNTSHSTVTSDNTFSTSTKTVFLSGHTPTATVNASPTLRKGGAAAEYGSGLFMSLVVVGAWFL